MDTIIKDIGKRIRTYRLQAGLSQEKLAEIASCDATYLSEIEQGKRNPSLKVIERIATALQIPLSRLFEKVDEEKDVGRNIPMECYEHLLSKTTLQQKMLIDILKNIDKYKNN